MRHLLFLLSLSFISLVSCSKEYQRVKIDRDCSGTYIEMNGNDYLVTNPSSISHYENGKHIHVTFDMYVPSPNSEPNFEDDIVCYLYHEHAGILTITSVK